MSMATKPRSVATPATVDLRRLVTAVWAVAGALFVVVAAIFAAGLYWGALYMRLEKLEEFQKHFAGGGQLIEAPARKPDSSTIARCAQNQVVVGIKATNTETLVYCAQLYSNPP
jgi:hypothetical protein